MEVKTYRHPIIGGYIFLRSDGTSSKSGGGSWAREFPIGYWTVGKLEEAGWMEERPRGPKIRTVEDKYIPSIVERIRQSPPARCSCGYSEDLICACGGTVRFVERIEAGRFDRYVCDGCGSFTTSYGLHLMHDEVMS